MSTNFNLLLYLKKPKRYQTGPVPVYLRITVNGKHCETAIGREIEPDLWDTERRRAKGTKEAARTFNHHIDSVLTKINGIQTHLLNSGDEIFAEDIRDAFTGKNTHSKMLLKIFEEHNAEVEKLIGNGFSDNTLRTFKSSIKHMEAFVRQKYKLDDISVKKVDQAFIKGYDTYLRTKRYKCTPISADKYVKHLKKMILLSLGNKWIVHNPFLHYKSKAKPTPRVFLTDDELKIISKKDLPVERLLLVRDIFIFCCYTGLSYIDVQKLKSTEIGKGDDGKQWLYTNRHKTETPVHLPLLPAALQIIENYKSHPLCIYKSTVLPVFTNQRMNAYLKEIADLCGIKKRLTFHMARHTFATTVTLSNGVPIETVSKMLGHNSIKTTQHYAKVLDAKTAKDMDALQQTLTQKDELIQEEVVLRKAAKKTSKSAKVIQLYAC